MEHLVGALVYLPVEGVRSSMVSGRGKDMVRVEKEREKSWKASSQQEGHNVAHYQQGAEWLLSLKLLWKSE